MTTRGFSLLELLVVLALITALSGVALLQGPRLLGGWRLAAAARQIVMELKFARARAILTSATHRVHFFTADSTYRQERQRASGTYDAIAAAAPLPTSVAIAACTAAGSGISFRPRGNAGAFGTVTLRNAYGQQRAVIVDIVGRIRVQ